MSKGDGEVVCVMVGEVLWAIVDMEVKSTGRGCTQKFPLAVGSRCRVDLILS